MEVHAIDNSIDWFNFSVIIQDKATGCGEWTLLPVIWQSLVVISAAIAPCAVLFKCSCFTHMIVVQFCGFLSCNGCNAAAQHASHMCLLMSEADILEELV